MGRLRSRRLVTILDSSLALNRLRVRTGPPCAEYAPNRGMPDPPKPPRIRPPSAACQRRARPRPPRRSWRRGPALDRLPQALDPDRGLRGPDFWPASAFTCSSPPLWASWSSRWPLPLGPAAGTRLVPGRHRGRRSGRGAPQTVRINALPGPMADPDAATRMALPAAPMTPVPIAPVPDPNAEAVAATPVGVKPVDVSGALRNRGGGGGAERGRDRRGRGGPGPAADAPEPARGAAKGSTRCGRSNGRSAGSRSSSRRMAAGR